MPLSTPEPTTALLNQAAGAVSARLAEHWAALKVAHPPARVGIVLGTGLGDWAQSALQDACTIPYEDIPGLPASGVDSHAGALLAGRVGQGADAAQVVALSGRVHMYEGYSAQEVSAGVRLLALLGVKTMVLTNAAGSLNPLYAPGSLMAITDHINHTGHSPLRGPNVDQWGPRFPDMSQVYCPKLVELARSAATECGLVLERGVYVQVLGPQLETPAETRALRRMGADGVGMSTVMEAIACAHMGLDVVGISCLTNQNLPDCMAETSLEEIVATAKAAGGDLTRLLGSLIPRLAALHQE